MIGFVDDTRLSSNILVVFTFLVVLMFVPSQLNVLMKFHFSPFLWIMCKPVRLFALQLNWLVSILAAEVKEGVRHDVNIGTKRFNLYLKSTLNGE